MTRYETRCEIDAALAIFAIRQFHRQIGRFPERLTDLVPDYLPRLPIDGADMQPLRYRREGDSYVLYSIGSDGVDHGGKSGALEFSWPGPTSQLDVVFNSAPGRGVTQ